MYSLSGLEGFGMVVTVSVDLQFDTVYGTAQRKVHNCICTSSLDLTCMDGHEVIALPYKKVIKLLEMPICLINWINARI